MPQDRRFVAASRGVAVAMSEKRLASGEIHDQADFAAGIAAIDGRRRNRRGRAPRRGSRPAAAWAFLRRASPGRHRLDRVRGAQRHGRDGRREAPAPEGEPSQGRGLGRRIPWFDDRLGLGGARAITATPTGHRGSRRRRRPRRHAANTPRLGDLDGLPIAHAMRRCGGVSARRVPRGGPIRGVPRIDPHLPRRSVAGIRRGSLHRRQAPFASDGAAITAHLAAIARVLAFIRANLAATAHATADAPIHAGVARCVAACRSGLEQHAGLCKIKARTNAVPARRRTGSADQRPPGDVLHEQHRRRWTDEPRGQAWKTDLARTYDTLRPLGRRMRVAGRPQSRCGRRGLRHSMRIRCRHQRARDGRPTHPGGDGAAGMDRIGGQRRQTARTRRDADRIRMRDRRLGRRRLGTLRGVPPTSLRPIGRPPRQHHRQEPTLTRLRVRWFGFVMGTLFERHGRRGHQVRGQNQGDARKSVNGATRSRNRPHAAKRLKRSRRPKWSKLAARRGNPADRARSPRSTRLEATRMDSGRRAAMPAFRHGARRPLRPRRRHRGGDAGPPSNRSRRRLSKPRSIEARPASVSMLRRSHSHRPARAAESAASARRPPRHSWPRDAAVA